MFTAKFHVPIKGDSIGKKKSSVHVPCEERKWRGRCFSLVSSDRVCGDGSKLCPRMFGLDIRKHFFTESMDKHWNRLPREVVDAPSLPVFETFGQWP